MCRYLLTEQSRLRSVNDIMPMIGARFYTQLDASQMRNDVIEEDLAKVYDGHYILFRNNTWGEFVCHKAPNREHARVYMIQSCSFQADICEWGPEKGVLVW